MPGQDSLALWDQLTHLSENPTQNDTQKIALESGVQMPSAPGAQSSEDGFAFNTWTAVMGQPATLGPLGGGAPSRRISDKGSSQSEQISSEI